MKILINPTLKQVEEFVKLKGYTKCRTSTIEIDSDAIEKRDRDKEVFTIPYGEDEKIHFIRYYDAWWNADGDRCEEDIESLIDYEFDEWEKYCEDRGIDPQGKW